jgi:hypothetical protein
MNLDRREPCRVLVPDTSTFVPRGCSNKNANIVERLEDFAVDLSNTEFRVLRETIGSRGTTRMVLLPVTMLGWAGLMTVILLFGEVPLAALLPLAVLVGGFEAIHALHVGVERIGRYLQVYYEGFSDGPRWETTVTAVGPGLPGGGIDPLFSLVFVCAAFVNMLPVVIPHPTRMELGVVGAFHIAFVFRVVRARGAAARQRAVELESFRALKSQAQSDGSG